MVQWKERDLILLRNILILWKTIIIAKYNIASKSYRVIVKLKKKRGDY